MAKLNLNPWSNTVQPISSCARAKTLLTLYSWDELPELCRHINQQIPHLATNHRVVCDADIYNLLSPSERERIQDAYIDGCSDIDLASFPEEIYEVDLPNWKIWEIWTEDHPLVDLEAVIDTILFAYPCERTRGMWKAYTNVHAHDYLNLDTLAEDLVSEIDDLLREIK